MNGERARHFSTATAQHFSTAFFRLDTAKVTWQRYTLQYRTWCRATASSVLLEEATRSSPDGWPFFDTDTDIARSARPALYISPQDASRPHLRPELARDHLPEGLFRRLGDA